MWLVASLQLLTYLLKLAALPLPSLTEGAEDLKNSQTFCRWWWAGPEGCQAIAST